MIKKIILGSLSSTKTLFDNLALKGITLFIGKNDNTLSLVENGVITTIAALAQVVYGSGKGYIEIPCSSTLTGKLLIQFGTVSVTPGSSSVVTFTKAFPANTICLLTSLMSSTAGATTRGTFGGTGGLTAATIYADGGTGSQTVGYIGIGY